MDQENQGVEVDQKDVEIESKRIPLSQVQAEAAHKFKINHKYIILTIKFYNPDGTIFKTQEMEVNPSRLDKLNGPGIDSHVRYQIKKRHFAEVSMESGVRIEFSAVDYK